MRSRGRTRSCGEEKVEKRDPSATLTPGRGTVAAVAAETADRPPREAGEGAPTPRRATTDARLGHFEPLDDGLARRECVAPEAPLHARGVVDLAEDVVRRRDADELVEPPPALGRLDAALHDGERGRAVAAAGLGRPLVAQRVRPPRVPPHVRAVRARVELEAAVEDDPKVPGARARRVV